jgi:adenylate cyclase
LPPSRLSYGSSSHETFVWRKLWADTVEPIGTLALSLIVSTSYEAARIRRVFRRFMPSWIAEQMLEANPEAPPETVEKDVTIVFCDIRDSTKLGETLPPATIEELLRRYFIAGEEAAIRLGTELDKFVGHEIMLFFEDRPGFEDHAIRGVRWALAIQDAAREIMASGLAGDIGFRVGVGVCTGYARVGLVGAKQRIQHTVVGDAVNTASRLQTATKEVNRLIVVGETTWQRAKHKFTGEELGEISVKAKEKPIRMYCPTVRSVNYEAERNSGTDT